MDMTVTIVCGHCFQRVPHALSEQPLTSNWVATCCGCCSPQTFSNQYIVDLMLESISYPRREHGHMLLVVQPDDGSPAFQINTDTENDVPDGYYQAVTTDMEQWYSVELHDHQVLEVLPIAPRL